MERKYHHLLHLTDVLCLTQFYLVNEKDPKLCEASDDPGSRLDLYQKGRSLEFGSVQEERCEHLPLDAALLSSFFVLNYLILNGVDKKSKNYHYNKREIKVKILNYHQR